MRGLARPRPRIRREEYASIGVLECCASPNLHLVSAQLARDFQGFLFCLLLRSLRSSAFARPTARQVSRLFRIRPSAIRYGIRQAYQRVRKYARRNNRVELVTG